MRPLHGTTLASMPTTLPRQAEALEQPPPSVSGGPSGMDVLKVARERGSGGGGSGGGGYAVSHRQADPFGSSSSIQLTPPRPPIAAGHRASFSARTSLTWEADRVPLDRGSFFESYASFPASAGGREREMATAHLFAEVSMSSLLSQSTRKFAQTQRHLGAAAAAAAGSVMGGSGAGLGRETSQSSFARMRKRGGVAARGSESARQSFGGGFSGAQTLRNAGGQRTLGAMQPYTPPRSLRIH